MKTPPTKLHGNFLILSFPCHLCCCFIRLMCIGELLTPNKVQNFFSLIARDAQTMHEAECVCDLPANCMRSHVKFYVVYIASFRHQSDKNNINIDGVYLMNTYASYAMQKIQRIVALEKFVFGGFCLFILNFRLA